jgi:hypothetical protein
VTGRELVSNRMLMCMLLANRAACLLDWGSWLEAFIAILQHVSFITGDLESFIIIGLSLFPVFVSHWRS